MSQKYTAITIGPISFTMQLVSSPAGLWGSSYIFSYIAKELCRILACDYCVPVENFISPYFEIKDGKVYLPEEKEDLCETMQKKGVGLFHDRIIFSSEEIENPLEKVKKARKEVINNLAVQLSDALKIEDCQERQKCQEWLNRYLRILAIEMSVPDNESPLVYLGKYLSCLELEPQFSEKEQQNPLLSLFMNTNSKDGFKNTVLKDSFLCKELDQWMLYKDDGRSIRDIDDIAGQGLPIQKKYQQYYAILKSDGDSMGKILESLSTLEEIRQYSRTCLYFCSKAAKVVQEFGGMPIYAGGDDLLMLLPLVGKNGNSILGLIETLRTAFNASFDNYRKKLENNPTISFGVAVQYYKSPLYEALERANFMLYKAKDSQIKNACFLNFQKHSGQSFELFELQMDKPTVNLFNRLNELINKTFNMESKENKESIEFLSGTGKQLQTFKMLFYQAFTDKNERERRLDCLFENLFDNVVQKQFIPYLEELKIIIKQIFDEQEEKLNKEKQDENYHNLTVKEKSEKQKDYMENCLVLTDAAIRFIHFLNE